MLVSRGARNSFDLLKDLIRSVILRNHNSAATLRFKQNLARLEAALLILILIDH